MTQKEHDRVFVISVVIAMIGTFIAATPLLLAPLLLVLLYRFR